jgi:ankyrin repeat protein
MDNWTPIHEIAWLNSGKYKKTNGTCTYSHLESYRPYNLDIIRLVKDGINIDAVTGANETALYIAASKGHYGVVKTLMLLGADPDIQNNSINGTTPEQIARFNGKDDVANFLERRRKNGK